MSFFWAHRVPGSELSEFLSAYYLCAKANSPSFSQNSPSLPQNSVSSLFRNSTLETVFRPFPISLRGKGLFWYRKTPPFPPPPFLQDLVYEFTAFPHREIGGQKVTRNGGPQFGSCFLLSDSRHLRFPNKVFICFHMFSDMSTLCLASPWFCGELCDQSGSRQVLGSGLAA